MVLHESMCILIPLPLWSFFILPFQLTLIFLPLSLTLTYCLFQTFFSFFISSIPTRIQQKRSFLSYIIFIYMWHKFDSITVTISSPSFPSSFFVHPVVIRIISFKNFSRFSTENSETLYLTFATTIFNMKYTCMQRKFYR